MGGNPTHVAAVGYKNRYSSAMRACTLLTRKGSEMAERVGFVPDEPAFLNGLGRIGTVRTRQIL